MTASFLRIVGGTDCVVVRTFFLTMEGGLVMDDMSDSGLCTLSTGITSWFALLEAVSLVRLYSPAISIRVAGFPSSTVEGES